jgi:hypothetical protein
VRRLFEVNSEPHTGARPSVRLCVGLIRPAPGGRGCAKNTVRDLAALVVLDERRVHEALIDAVSAEREGRAYVTLVFLNCRSKRNRMLVLILLMNTKRELGFHTQTLGTVLHRGVQADARGTTQVLKRGGQAVARGSCLSQLLDRGA